MPSTTLTSKGQMTLPKEIRERFNLKTGDRIDFVVEGDRIMMVPAKLGLKALSAFLPPPARHLTLEDMRDVVKRRARRSQ